MNTDADKIYWGLTIWANNIETGNPGISGENAKLHGIERKYLEQYQVDNVARIRKLADLAQQGKITVQE